MTFSRKRRILYLFPDILYDNIITENPRAVQRTGRSIPPVRPLADKNAKLCGYKETFTDRRIAKTRKAIFAAFDALIVRKDYAKISVQDIIDEADIGRSTFYEHFETKDELLRAKCTDLFRHIFVPDGTEKTHAFSRNSTFEEKIAHILCHLLDDKKVVKGILAGESGEPFLRFFRGCLKKMAEDERFCVPGVPAEYLQNHIAGAFVETVRWWTERDCAMPPEELCRCFLALLPPMSPAPAAK